MEGLQYAYCSEYSWYGWAPKDKQASISTTLHGIGKAVLEFGNCWKSGKVVAYKNNVVIDSVNGRNEVQVEFDFQDGDVLKITKHGEGIIRFDDLRFDWCHSSSDEYVICDANSHVNNLKGSKSQSVSGWTFDPLINGPWNKNAPNNGESCSDASWLGWATDTTGTCMLS